MSTKAHLVLILISQLVAPGERIATYEKVETNSCDPEGEALRNPALSVRPSRSFLSVVSTKLYLTQEPQRGIDPPRSQALSL